MQLSKNKIGKRLVRKRDPQIAEALLLAKNSPQWIKVAQRISNGRRKYASINLDQLDAETKDGETVVVIGRVLGSGTLNKKIKLRAFGYSASAKEKLGVDKIEMGTIAEEIKNNPDAKGVKVI